MFAFTKTRCWKFFYFAAIVLINTSLAWAADNPDKPPEPGGVTDYLMAWAVVALGIVLGMVVVLSPSRRRDRAQIAAYVEKSAAADKH